MELIQHTRCTLIETPISPTLSVVVVGKSRFVSVYCFENRNLNLFFHDPISAKLTSRSIFLTRYLTLALTLPLILDLFQSTNLCTVNTENKYFVLDLWQLCSNGTANGKFLLGHMAAINRLELPVIVFLMSHCSSIFFSVRLYYYLLAYSHSGAGHLA